MATLHLVKRGRNPSGSVTRSFLLDLQRVIAAFPALRPNWFPDKPVLDKHHATTGFEPFRYVVVEVDDHEATPPYSKAGYYILEARPLEVASKLGLEA